jgi:hypothetical protein
MGQATLRVSASDFFQELVAHPSFNISVLRHFHLAPLIALFQKQYRDPSLKRFRNRREFNAWPASNIQCGRRHLISRLTFHGFSCASWATNPHTVYT